MKLNVAVASFFFGWLKLKLVYTGSEKIHTKSGTDQATEGNLSVKDESRVCEPRTEIKE
jgi:hypothetical protein